MIKDDPDSEFELMPDHEVRLIEKNRLYVFFGLSDLANDTKVPR